MTAKIKKAIVTAGLALVVTLGLAAPALAVIFTRITLGAWWEDVTVKSGTKYSGSGSALISLSSNSPNGGNFWVTKDDSQISKSVDVHAGNSKGSSYYDSNDSGTVVLHAHQIGFGSGTDYITGSVNFNN